MKEIPDYGGSFDLTLPFRRPFTSSFPDLHLTEIYEFDLIDKNFGENMTWKILYDAIVSYFNSSSFFIPPVVHQQQL